MSYGNITHDGEKMYCDDGMAPVRRDCDLDNGTVCYETWSSRHGVL